VPVHPTDFFGVESRLKLSQKAAEMAYRMPNNYSKDDDDDYDSQEEGSVAASVDIDSEYEESEAEGSEEEQEEEQNDRRQRRPPERSNSPPRRLPPRRAKSFQEDTILSRQGGSHRGASTSHRSGDGRRGLPVRSQSHDGGHNNSMSSMRSAGGPRMPRRELSKSSHDKDAIASNRARRLRAMGDGPKNGKVQLLRRSQSFRGPSSKSNSLLVDVEEEGGADDNKEEGTKRGDRRTTSNDLSKLAPEERQYARTAARGITRSKSMIAEKPNLEKASNAVANRLSKMRVAGEGGPKSRLRNSGGDEARKDDPASPKAVTLQW
jgi:hypothetical protein